MAGLDDLELDDLQPEDEEQGMFEHFRLAVDPGQAPMRVDKFMATHLEDTSRHRVQTAIKEGYVRVGDKVVKANYIVRPNDVIRFVMPYRRRGVEILPEDIPLDIVYEDDDVLIVNKPAGMVVHPGHGNYDGIRGTETTTEPSSTPSHSIWGCGRKPMPATSAWVSWCIA